MRGFEGDGGMGWVLGTKQGVFGGMGDCFKFVRSSWGRVIRGEVIAVYRNLI